MQRQELLAFSPNLSAYEAASTKSRMSLVTTLRRLTHRFWRDYDEGGIVIDFAESLHGAALWLREHKDENDGAYLKKEKGPSNIQLAHAFFVAAKEMRIERRAAAVDASTKEAPYQPNTAPVHVRKQTMLRPVALNKKPDAEAFARIVRGGKAVRLDRVYMSRASESAAHAVCVEKGATLFRMPPARCTMIHACASRLGA